MPNELSYMPFFVGDFLVTVGTWPGARAGAYALALFYQWEHGGLPADDPQELASILHASKPGARKLWDEIQQRGKFEKRADGLWWNKRVEIVRAEARKQVAKATDRAKKGAAARWGKGANAHMPEHSLSNAQAMPKQCLDDANQLNRSTTPPNPPAGAGGRPRRRRKLTQSQIADAEHIAKSREVKRLIEQEHMSRSDAVRKVGYR